MTSLQGVFPQPKITPKRNFIKENVKNLRERGNRRMSAQAPSTTPNTANRRAQSTTRDSRASIVERTSHPITFIKEPPKTFPKAKSVTSVASFSSYSDGENFCSNCPSQHSNTREASIQTVDPTDEHFLKDVYIRMPSPSVIDKLREDLESINLEQVSKKRQHVKKSSMDRLLYKLSVNNAENLESLLGGDSSLLNHDLKRTNHLQRLQQFTDSNSVQEKDSLPELHESEHMIVNNVRKMAEERRKQFAEERTVQDEESLDDFPSTAMTVYPESSKSEGRSCKSMSSQMRGALPLSYRKGEVPRYLREIKEKTEENQRLEAAIDVNCPPGHIGLTDEERLEALAFAHLKFNELIAELNKLPLTSHTVKMKQRKIEIDRELDKLEQSIRIFSRAKVYVKLEPELTAE